MWILTESSADWQVRKMADLEANGEASQKAKSAALLLQAIGPGRMTQISFAMAFWTTLPRWGRVESSIHTNRATLSLSSPKFADDE